MFWNFLWRWFFEESREESEVTTSIPLDTSIAYAKCDARACPARVQGYFIKENGKFVLGFCSHHFSYYQPALVSRHWEAATNEINE